MDNVKHVFLDVHLVMQMAVIHVIQVYINNHHLHVYHVLQINIGIVMVSLVLIVQQQIK
jgi:hypothetical protein